MKRLLCIVLLIALIVVMVGCGNKVEQPKTLTITGQIVAYNWYSDASGVFATRLFIQHDWCMDNYKVGGYIQIPMNETYTFKMAEYNHPPYDYDLVSVK